MNKNSFSRGLFVGVIITVVLLVGSLGSMLVLDVAHLGQLVEVIHKVKIYSFSPVSLEGMIDGAMNGIVESLDDVYSDYLHPGEYQDLEEHISGTYGGIGLLITESENNSLMVVSPFKGTPAYKAGIKTGDKIIEINGRDAAELGLAKSASLMKGEPGTEVNLTVITKEGGSENNKEYNIVRELIHIPSVEGERLGENKEIAYLNLMMFSQQTGEDLESLLKEITVDTAKGVILDLRDNPGGALDAALDVVGYFIPQGPAVHIVSKEEERALSTSDNYIDKPLVVLVNEGSASASEIVAGAIKDTGSGTLVGTKTFGKGLVQSVFEIRSGAALKLTTAKYLTPNRHDINKKGIHPDITIKMDPELERKAILMAPDLENDLQLQRAVEILKEY
ncbi:MAG: S41 family peptidase [Clostridia bacterium]|nr:S41 family peptidase [Clostridia bacterium]